MLKVLLSRAALVASAVSFSTAFAQTTSFVVDATASDFGGEAPISGFVGGDLNYSPKGSSVSFSSALPQSMSVGSALFEYLIAGQSISAPFVSVDTRPGRLTLDLSGMSFSILSGTALDGADGGGLTWDAHLPSIGSTGTFAGSVVVNYNYFGLTDSGTLRFSGRVTPATITSAGALLGVDATTTSGTTLTLPFALVLDVTEVDFTGVGLVSDIANLTSSLFGPEYFASTFVPIGGTVVAFSNVTPVPEPETYAMLLAGLALLGFEGRRRRKLQHTAA